MAGEAQRAKADRAGMQRRSRAKSRCTRKEPRRPRRRERAFGPCAMRGIARAKTCIRHGSRNCSTRRSTQALSWPAMHDVLRDPIAQRPVQPSGSARGRERARHSTRLRRRSLLPARLFRLQDGAAVRLFEVHARRRRQGAEMPTVVEHREGGTAAGRRCCCNRQTARAPAGLFGVFGTRGAATARDARKASPEAERAGAGLRILPEDDHRQRRAFRQRANDRRTTTTPTTIPCR